ncbi:STAS domain-containing protein [Pseudonocardia spirodelae]|uniref:STAS domain-containing protein n=1 Tax=Pseudonocardia spirodelae TaxID=3133431 RepID=A0ABU8TE03_9PSEU
MNPPTPLPARRALTGTDPVPALVHVGRTPAATVVVSLSGEVDLATAPDVEELVLGAVDAAAGGRVVVDLNGVRFLGLRGVATLRAAVDHARRGRAVLVVVLDPASPAARALDRVPGHGLTVVAADVAEPPVADAS